MVDHNYYEALLQSGSSAIDPAYFGEICRALDTIAKNNILSRKEAIRSKQVKLCQAIDAVVKTAMGEDE